MNPILDEKLCNSCGLCQSICPTGALYGAIPKLDDRLCITCGHCVSFCPTGAFSQGFAGDQEASVASFTSQELNWKKLLTMRRSIRKYKSQCPSEQLLEELGRVAGQSGTASNSRSWKLIYLFHDEIAQLSKDVCKSLYDEMKWLNNPIAPALLRGTNLRKYTKPYFVKPFIQRLKRGITGEQDSLFYDAPVVALILYPKGDKLFGLTDTAFAAWQMNLYGQSQGLGSCHIGFATRAFRSKKLYRKWCLPKGYAVGQVFTLGYPAVEPKRRPLRAVNVEKRRDRLYIEPVKPKL